MLEQTTVIDLVGHDPVQHRCALVLLIEAGELARPDALWLLQEKLNGYAAFAVDGQMHRLHPDTKGQPVTIIIRPCEAVPGTVANLIDQIAAIFKQDGITIRVDPLPPAAEAA